MSAEVGHVALHASGPQVSRLALGAWRIADAGLDAAAIRSWVEAALDCGIDTVDHADIYGGYACEERFGAALADAPELRDRLTLVTKCGIKLVSPRRPEHRLKHYDTSAAHIRASVEESLRALRTDRVDLLLLHRPDPLMDADDTAAGLESVVRDGHVLHVGLSNFPAVQTEALAARLPVPLVTNQLELSALAVEPFADGTLDRLALAGTRPMAWSPLGGGRLFDPADARAIRVRAALVEVGEEIGADGVEQVALAWLLAHPAGIVPVLGTTRPERVRLAAGAVALALDRQQWFRVYEASVGAEVP